jgi:hypothetical protein
MELTNRYEDFVVNEVGTDGKVIVLKNTKYENPTKPEESRNNGQKTPKVQLPLVTPELTTSPPLHHNLKSIFPHFQTFFPPKQHPNSTPSTPPKETSKPKSSPLPSLPKIRVPSSTALSAQSSTPTSTPKPPPQTPFE